MKILHILQSNELSGAENVVADICMMFNGEYEMAYCSPEGPIREALVDRNVNYISIKKMNLSAVRRAVKSYKPDLIHAHDVRATVLATWAAGKIPVVSHLHGNTEDMRKFGIKSLMYMVSTNKIKKVISVSESILVDFIFKKHIEKKTSCLRNIIYLPRIEKLVGKDDNVYNFDFAYIGRITYPKNPQRVAKVASQVLRQSPHAIFGIIGEGDLKGEMEVVFKNEGVADRVVFTGRLAYPYNALKQAKCMLMCSRFEGTPIAALESMALGVPIVSTPVDGMLNLVIDRETGFLNSDDLHLAGAVIKLISEKEHHNEMSIASIKRFESLNEENDYKKQLKGIYSIAINS